MKETAIVNEVSMLIGGKRLSGVEPRDVLSALIPSPARWLRVRRPRRSPMRTPQVEAAAAAFPAWSALRPTERRARLLKAADIMDARAGAFIECGMAETGAMANWYGFNVHLAANMLRAKRPP